MEQELADKDYELFILLCEAREVITSARAKELRKYNANPAQASILHVLHVFGNGFMPADIARKLIRKPHSISEMLQKMKKNGLVKIIRNNEIRNRRLVILTEKGCELYAKTTLRKSIHKVLSVLSEEEKQQLHLYLQKLKDSALKELGSESSHVSSS